MFNCLNLNQSKLRSEVDQKKLKTTKNQILLDLMNFFCECRWSLGQM